MTSLDRCRFPPSLWRALRLAGVEPSKVLRIAGLPAGMHLERDRTFSTGQLFALWKAIASVDDEDTIVLRILQATDQAGHQPAFLAAFYAASFRDAVHRVERFKRLGSCEQIEVDERGGLWTLSKEWPFANEREPDISAHLSFAFLLQLGRRGSGQHLVPMRLELTSDRHPGNELKSFFGCPMILNAPRNLIVFRSSDLDLPFTGHSGEFLDLVIPALAAALAEFEAGGSVAGQVKVLLKRAMASGRPTIATIARDLGWSERTLQRRITEENTTFRDLLHDARCELARQLLTDSTLEVEEIACMLGYNDITSFYRAFKGWEGIAPGEWRQRRCPPDPAETGSETCDGKLRL